MAINSLVVLRVILLALGLTAFYTIGTVTHAFKKMMAWFMFQVTIVLLWLSSSYRYHGHWNPLPQVVAFMIGVFSLGILAILWIFAMGMMGGEGSLEGKRTRPKAKT